MRAVDTKREQSGVRSIPAVRGRVLVVDDHVNTRDALASLLAEQGYETVTAGDGEAALALATQWAPDLVLTDLSMPKMDGVELCRRLHQHDPDLPVIVMTAAEQSEAGHECLIAGAEDFLSKPVNATAVFWSVARAFERRGSKRDRERLRVRAEELVERLRAVNEQLVVSSLREQARAETEVRLRAELNALLQRLGEGVVVVDDSGCVRLMNDAAMAILEISRKPARIEALQAFELRDVHGRALRDDERPLHRALHGVDFADYLVGCFVADGRQRDLLTTGTSVKDASGKVAQAIVVFRDVTDLRRLERHREEYTALISHDLGNPLNVILMSAQLLKESLFARGLTSDVDSMSRIERNALRMSAMLKELSEATSLESPNVEKQRVPCDLRKLVVDILRQLDEPRARRVTIEATDAAPYLVLADAEQLERLITNLLTNALKYSGADAPVRVCFSQTPSHAQLAVIDRGIGIAPESIKAIFDRYHRTAAGRGRAEGLGLGLYITRLIAEAHGGRVDVVSAVGKGSTFTLTLPLMA